MQFGTTAVIGANFIFFKILRHSKTASHASVNPVFQEDQAREQVLSEEKTQQDFRVEIFQMHLY